MIDSFGFTVGYLSAHESLKICLSKKSLAVTEYPQSLICICVKLNVL